ncbi:MAG: type VI secretion protein [Ruminococcaceae bacterium]|nr:type VI secretion protein [Oscillospiraceae bacterium]
MVDNEKLKERLRAEAFKRNNGLVLRTINILRTKFNNLTTVKAVCEDSGVSEGEFIDSVNYLNEAEYIKLRDIATRCDIVFADANYKDLEAKLTAKGIRLLAGGINDELIDI